ncbi:MAG TPA: TonB-dependent receptor [Vicinamibacterales bacterium]|nr:TonB-dependent receptor [Vicinamibacterales bacterium]
MLAFVAALLVGAGQFGQSTSGELRIIVRDSIGLAVQCRVTLVSEANDVSQQLDTGADGLSVAKRLPFGQYRIAINQPGFAPYDGRIEIDSALPRQVSVTLTPAAIQAQVTVRADDTLLDTHQTSAINRVGRETLQQRITTLPGRSLADVVNTEPGWLLEANGILHPRGSEYQVQYVVDGLPVTDNRSPSFAPELDADGVHSMSILTGGYPAEYGRKLGGVIEVVTAANPREGVHGSAVASVGSFATANGGGAVQYGWARTLVGISGSAAHTDRYLDPPVEENFTNTGTGSNVAIQFEREFSYADRLGVVIRHGQSSFLVPNERIQEEAGQRQQRSSHDTTGVLSYQRVVSSSLVGDVRAMIRTVGAGLASNDVSTPIAAFQDRGFSEMYLKGTITGHAGPHEWKAGMDANFGSVREAFSYALTDPTQFDPGTLPTFSFLGRGTDREQAAFVQDQLRLGAWTLNAGLRWDHYHLLVQEQALSPRVGVAWSWPRADLVLRASYDRAFQTPAIENLLLASSPTLDSVNDTIVRVPVRPSLGHFFEAGLSKRLFSVARVDVTQYGRRMKDSADDDVLLNTGVSFPIAFDRAEIHGTELKLEIPRWGAWSGFASYSYLRGTGFLPITGGLLLGDDAASALTATNAFPITQDQRHTMRGRVAYQLSDRAWVAMAVSYGSGLPVEFVGDPAQALAQYGPRIVGQVDFDEERVRPSASIDAAFSAIVFKTERTIARAQVNVVNLTDRLNVINFASLFSGTALGPPRSFGVRWQFEF